MIKVIILIIIIIAICCYYIHNNIYKASHIINSFFGHYCNDPAVFNCKYFPWTQYFRNNWLNIKNEYITYSNQYLIPYHKKINQRVASCDKNNSWKTLYLRVFNKNTLISKFFPQTMKLINSCDCTLAFFSILEPGSQLTPHVGIYKGVIRYHLGLIVPDDWQKCFINIDGNILYWHEGQDIMFDDMFIHFAQNNTNQQRVILFLDIKRDFHNIFLNTLNNIFLKFIKSNDILLDTVKNINSYAP